MANNKKYGLAHQRTFCFYVRAELPRRVDGLRQPTWSSGPWSLRPAEGLEVSACPWVCLQMGHMQAGRGQPEAVGCPPPSPGRPVSFSREATLSHAGSPGESGTEPQVG